MCLIIFAHRCHPRYPLIVAANRDEFFSRPTRSAGFWEEYPDILAGKDLKYGGSWMGINRNGRFAAVTNYREADAPTGQTLSRGMIVHDFLVSDLQPEVFLEEISKKKTEYKGFNLILGNPRDLYYYSNRKNGPEAIEPGIHTLSNHLLDTAWPKSVRIRDSFSALIKNTQIMDHASLLEILLDQTAAEEDQLPDTGFGKQWEKLLSPVFVSSETYGTRNSTAILVDCSGRVTYAEQSFQYQGDPGNEIVYQFNLDEGDKDE